MLQEHNSMKNNTKDKAKGKIHLLFGKVKETAGKLTGSPGLKAEGQVEVLEGKALGKIARIKKQLSK
jgi:uncharacterized protein YjbJ (UPF0337 family)